MKLALISPFQFQLKRGIERFVWSLSSELEALGVEVHLFTWNCPNSVQWGKTPQNLHIHQVPHSRYFSRYWAIPFYIFWLMVHKFDHVIVCFAGYGERQALLLAKIFRDQRYSIIFHFPVQLVPHQYKEFQVSSFAQKASLRIAVSQYVARGVEQTFNRNCLIISNGVNPYEFRPSKKLRESVRAELGLDTNTPVLITVAALEERKGIQWIIHALPRLVDEYPKIQYLVLGDGPYRNDLEALVQLYGVQENVRFLGKVDNVVPYLASADIGCLLSHGEAFGIALVEYSAMGLPVLCSKHPPFPQIAKDSWSISVNEKLTGEVVSSLKHLLSDPELRVRMGKDGRDDMLRYYSWQQIAKIYKEVLTME